jgi:hypothetical protein
MIDEVNSHEDRFIDDDDHLIKTIPLPSSNLIEPPGGLEPYMVGSHWCMELIPWQISRIVLDTIRTSFY